MDQAMNVLLSMSLFSVGDVIRLARCNYTFYTLTYNHEIFWKNAAVEHLGWSKVPKANLKVVHSIRNTNKCKECGKNCKTHAVTKKWKYKIICSECTEHGYNELISRKQLMEYGFRIRDFRSMHIAKKLRSGAHLYWKHSVTLVKS